jgi:hypothetical protein
MHDRPSENRLSMLSTVNGTPATWIRTNVFVYDYQGWQQRYSNLHPGDKFWHQLMVSWDVPRDYAGIHL